MPSSRERLAHLPGRLVEISQTQMFETVHDVSEDFGDTAAVLLQPLFFHWSGLAHWMTSARPEIPACGAIPLDPFRGPADQLHAVLIIETTAIATVEQLACDVRRVEETGFLILELVKAAASAAVAQSLPLAAVERGQGFFPKWGFAVHLKSSLALLSPKDQALHWGIRS